MKLGYYHGCSLDSSGIEYGVSTERTAQHLGIELVEVEDWSCCGATSAHNTNQLLSLALPARNLAIAEKDGLDVLAPCAACYNRFKTTGHIARHDASVREKIVAAIGMDYQAANETFSILELLWERVGLDKIKAAVKNPLTGLKAVCYYGCLLVRPDSHIGFEDPEDPKSMDEILEALGAESIDWAFKTECCGAALSTSRPDVGNKMTYEILRQAVQSGAGCIVTACPLCMMNLDMRQPQVGKRFNTQFNIPVYYITELTAIACGDSPQQVMADKHFVDALTYLHNLKITG